MQEIVVTGKHYRIMTNLINKVWTRVSYWKLARDISFDNGKDLESTCGTITGITDSITSTSSTTCASSYAVKKLYDKINQLNQ